MAFPIATLRQLTASAASLTASEARGIVEIACLAIITDGEIDRAELEVLRDLGAELRVDGVDSVIERSVGLGERTAQLDRLRELGASLSNETARHVAYKVTLLVAMADRQAADQEFEFDLDVQDALDLATTDADRLTSEVEALVAGV